MPFLVSHPIELSSLIVRVQAPARGAVATFLGLVRDHHGGREVLGLEYSAYGPMVEAECEHIVAEAAERFAAAIALEHRVGALDIGDVAVGIAAAAPHRDAAFNACRYVIEEVKRRLPIWKRESYADGSVAWVDPTAPGGVVPSVEGAKP